MSWMITQKYEKAIACFYGGLQALLQRVPTAQNQPTSDRCDTTAANLGNHQDILFSIGLPSSCEEETRDSIADTNEAFVIFNRVLQLSPEALTSIDVKSLSNHVLPGILLFNLALAYHKVGLASGDSSTLARALDLYGVACNTFGNASSLSNGSVANYALLCLANNIGHIHVFFRNFKDAGNCSDEISRRLGILLQEPTNETPTIEDEDYRPFFLHVAFLRRADILPAAAA